MMRYKLGEGLTEGCIEDAECQQIGVISAEETVDILNAYDAMLKRQAACKHCTEFTNIDGRTFFVPYSAQKLNRKQYCPDCGKDLNDLK